MLFEPSALNDPEATTVTLCWKPTEDACELMSTLDAWCIATISDNPTYPLGIQLKTEQTIERFVSCLMTNDKGLNKKRCKINKCGRSALQCLTPDKEKREHPEVWRGSSIQPRLVLKRLYAVGGEVGSILECTHCLLHESKDDKCPF